MGLEESPSGAEVIWGGATSRQRRELWSNVFGEHCVLSLSERKLGVSQQSCLPLLRIMGYCCAFMRKYWTRRPFQERTSERKQAALQKQQFLPTPLATCLSPWGISLFIICNRISHFALMFVLIWMLNIPAALYLATSKGLSTTQRNRFITFSFYACTCEHSTPYRLVWSFLLIPLGSH